MIIKLLFFKKNNFVWLTVFLVFLLSSYSYSQCAGSDSSVSICNVQNPVNQNIDLFGLLGGSPTTGGIWYDNSKPVGENDFNGIVNAQTLLNSGIYTYTYVQPSTSCTNNQATVTLKIGPYAGSPSPNISTCDDVESFNLFAAFDGTKLAPQQNGVWTNTNTGAVLTGNTINPKALGEGTYTYTYTIDAVDSCPAQSATVSITVFRKPKSGTPSNLTLCSTDLASYRDVNLSDQIAGEDLGGRWSETSTAELSGSADNRIDIEHIYNTLGAGTYYFTYTILSASPICTDSRSTVRVIIEEPLDFTGATLVVHSDICENEIGTAVYSATLTRGPKAIPNGNYDVNYSINNGTTSRSFNANGNFSNGNFVFNIDRANLPAVGNYTFSINSIVNRGSTNLCTNIIGTISDVLTIYPLPQINTATIKIDPVCSGFDVEGEISGTSNLTNDTTYRIEYAISGANTANNQILTFTVLNGVATFSIPASLLPNTGTNSIFRIVNITNLNTGCFNVASLSKEFTINPVPDVSDISVSIANECLEGDTVVELTGLGELTDITLDYSLTGANSAINQIANVAVNDGKANYIIPVTVLTNSGTTTFTLNAVTNDDGGCAAAVLANNTASFTLSNCNVFIPNGFSPNGDTVNDTFRIPQIEFMYPDFSLEIYNRYGNLLFKGNKNKTEWNGRNSDYKIGIDGVAPNGVYFYILHFNKGNKKPLQGTLYLNR